MADWSIDPGFHEEPTHVPTGDECTEQCSHSDCPTCGHEVAALRHREAQAMADAQEVR